MKRQTAQIKVIEKELLLKMSETWNRIAFAGTTGSGKSSAQKEAINPLDRIIMKKNIGVANQTTRINIEVGVSQSLEGKGKVLVSLEKRDTPMIYITNIIDGLSSMVLKKIDKKNHSITRSDITDEIVEKTMNPGNREYRIYGFCKENLSDDDMEDFASILFDISNIDMEDLKARISKEMSLKKSRYKGISSEKIKEEIVLDMLSEKLDTGDIQERLNLWFGNLEKKIEQTFSFLLLGTPKLGEKTLAKFFPYYKRPADVPKGGEDEREVDELKNLINKILDDESPYSLVFSGLKYITVPSDKLLKRYDSFCQERDIPNGNFSMMIIDTMGINHKGENSVEEGIDKVFSKEFDALIFFIEWKDSESLLDKTLSKLDKKLEKKPIPTNILRTHKDVAVETLANNLVEQEKGEIEFEDYQEGAEYFARAVKEVEELVSKQGEGTSFHSKIRSLSLNMKKAKDITNLLREYYPDAADGLNPDAIYDLLFEMKENIANRYSEEGIVAATLKNTSEEILTPVIDGNVFKASISNLIALNEKERQGQYVKYINGEYHGRSISNYRCKHINGEGHITKSNTRANFRIHIASMISKWLRDENIIEQITSSIEIDESNLLYEGKGEVASISDRLKKFYEKPSERWSLYSDLSKYLSYKAMKEEFDRIYATGSWQHSFQENLKLFDKKFSDNSFWEKGITDWAKTKSFEIGTRMLDMRIPN